MKVFIVVLNWNREKDTLECLRSIGGLSKVGVDLEVVVVDNASKEKSIQKIRKFDGFPVKIIENSDNFGFAKGNNTGIEYALKQGADWVMVLNNDTILDSRIIVEFAHAVKNEKKVGAITPKIYFAKGYEYHKEKYLTRDLGRVIWSSGGVIDWNNVYANNKGVDLVDRGLFKKAGEVDFATGTCVFLSAAMLKEIGYFDEKYFMYFEDVDLSWRMKKQGWKILYEPAAVVWHKVAQSSGVGSGLNDYFLTRNRILFALRYAGVRAKLAVIRESVRLLITGRNWQKKGVIDFYLGRFGRGSWK